jgi:hypothetical protein
MRVAAMYWAYPSMGGAPVVVMEATEDGNGLDAPVGLRRSSHGLLLGERLVRARTVVPPCARSLRLRAASPENRPRLYGRLVNCPCARSARQSVENEFLTTTAQTADVAARGAFV